MEKILQKCTEVFPEKPSKGLPPKRFHDFHIELKEGGSPQKKGLYRIYSFRAYRAKHPARRTARIRIYKAQYQILGSTIFNRWKKDGSSLMNIDYHAVNRLTAQKSYPLPRIDDILNQNFEKRYFRKLDLRSGYHRSICIKNLKKFSLSILYMAITNFWSYPLV